MKRNPAQPGDRSTLIPDFCNARALIQLALLIELVVIVLSLASTSRSQAAELRFVTLSLFLQWIALCSAAVLCMARRWLRLAGVRVVFLMCWGLLLLVTAALSLLAWELDLWLQLGVPLGSSPWPFVIRNLLISAIVSLLMLRYFWERHQWEEETRAESEARYLALQARIRPHFLFNALNSLAELIRSQPDKAEAMVEDLADLFRVSLDARQKLIPLSEEIEMVKGYMRIEEIRLSNKLMVNWDLSDESMRAAVPRLILQPLVENAVLHGISRLRARGMLHVVGRREGEYLIVDVENPLPPEEAAPRTGGSGTAVTNIAQRIKLIYGDRARLILGQDTSEYGPFFRARLRLPFVPYTEGSTGGAAA